MMINNIEKEEKENFQREQKNTSIKKLKNIKSTKNILKEKLHGYFHFLILEQLLHYNRYVIYQIVLLQLIHV